MCITVINDVTLISIGYDYATPSKFPERWVLPALSVVGSSIMFVATSSSLLLLYFCLDSNEPGSLFQRLGLGGLTYGHIVTNIFKVATWRALIAYNAWNINNDVNFQPSALGRCFNALTCSSKKQRKQRLCLAQPSRDFVSRRSHPRLRLAPLSRDSVSRRPRATRPRAALARRALAPPSRYSLSRRPRATRSRAALARRALAPLSRTRVPVRRAQPLRRPRHPPHAQAHGPPRHQAERHLVPLANRHRHRLPCRAQRHSQLPTQLRCVHHARARSHQQRDTTIRYIHTSENRADLFTKALPSPVIRQHLYAIRQGASFPKS